MDKVLILLSTYNGEQYLQEQLDSLYSQEGVDLSILVRDDGSNDNTCDILNRNMQNHSNLRFIQGENVGWKISFMNLIKIVFQTSDYNEYDYYAFCDQDDIWLPNKLARGIFHLKNLSPKIKLYCSNQYYYKNGQNEGLIRHESVQPTIQSCLIRNYAIGCTIIFNRALLNLIAKRPPLDEYPHDFWFYQVAVLTGSVYVDDEAYILYRQHSNNQIGCKRGRKDIWKRRKKQMRSFFECHERENQAKDLLRLYGDFFTKDTKLKVEKVAHYRKRFLNRLCLIFDNNYTTNIKSNDLWLKLRILLGHL